MADEGEIKKLNNTFNVQAVASGVIQFKMNYMLLTVGDSVRLWERDNMAARENNTTVQQIKKTDADGKETSVWSVLFKTRALAESFLREKPASVIPDVREILELGADASGKVVIKAAL